MRFGRFRLSAAECSTHSRRGDWAPWLERASRRPVQQRRRHARNTPLAAFLFQRRQAGNQHAAIGVQWVREDVAHRRELDDLARVHHPKSIHRLRHQPHVVSDQNHRRANFVLYLLQGVQNLALHDDVERAGRLVGNDDAWGAG